MRERGVYPGKSVMGGLQPIRQSSLSIKTITEIIVCNHQFLKTSCLKWTYTPTHIITHTYSTCSGQEFLYENPVL